jgi:nucleoside-triphosphatase THEP1
LDDKDYPIIGEIGTVSNRLRELRKVLAERVADGCSLLHSTHSTDTHMPINVLGNAIEMQGLPCISR